MTHAESARRRGEIKRGYLAGERACDLSVQHKVSQRRVYQILREAGLSKAPGRPTLTVPTEHMRQYKRWRERYGAAFARQMIALGGMA